MSHVELIKIITELFKTNKVVEGQIGIYLSWIFLINFPLGTLSKTKISIKFQIKFEDSPGAVPKAAGIGYKDIIVDLNGKDVKPNVEGVDCVCGWAPQHVVGSDSRPWNWWYRCSIQEPRSKSARRFTPKL